MAIECTTEGCNKRHATDDELEHVTGIMAEMIEVGRMLDLVSRGLMGEALSRREHDEGVEVLAGLQQRLWELSSQYHVAYAEAYGLDYESGEPLDLERLHEMGRA